MALVQISPFSFDVYRKQVGKETITGIIKATAKQYGNWEKLLGSYSFRNWNWQHGRKVRDQLHVKLRAQKQDSNAFFAVCNEILESFGMQSLGIGAKSQVAQSVGLLDLLDSNPAQFGLVTLYVDRIASTSKVFEMWNPASWVITDSYCTRALARMVRAFWNSTGKETQSDLLRIPQAPGRTGDPEPQFPRMAATAKGQIRLGFIYASWLCRLIAGELHNASPQIRWRAADVEMVAFTIGH